MGNTRSEKPPAPTSLFVGRVRELEELGRVVERGGLVSVLGPPGIGKTRLVLEWLRGALRSGTRPWVRFCDLSDATTGADVLRLVAKTLGVSLVAGEGASVDLIGSTLAAAGAAVLAVDNVEHVLDLAYPFLTAWLAAAPELRFVVTSRERLKLDGEHVFELGPLAAVADDDDGVRLFVERARAVRPGSVPAEELGVVRELVGELDGNPLAIELAAARVRVLTPREILAGLERRFEVLVAERRGEPRRSALLEAIAASWNLLPSWGKAALADCSVFRGGFDLPSAEAVLELRAHEGAPPVAFVLESLCDKSLVAVRDANPRRGLRFHLHASIRAFAATPLEEEGRGPAVRDRHARHFARAAAAWAARSRGPDAPEALDELRRDVENLTTALRHLLAGPKTRANADDALVLATTLAIVLGSDGPFTLRAELLDQAIAFGEAADASPALLVEALDASVMALVAIGRSDAARTNVERARALAEPLGDALVGRVESTLGLVRALSGREEEATSSFEASLASLRRAGDRLYEGRALGRLGWLDWSTGRLESARTRLRDAVAIHREVGDRMFEAMNSGYLATVAHELGDIETTQPLLEHAIAEQRALGHRRVEADLTAALGTLLHERGLYEEALALHRRALATYRRIGHTRDEASLLCDMARVELDRGALDEARAAFEEALPRARATANGLTIGDAEAGLGIIAARRGRLDEARAHFDRARAASPPGPRGADLVELLAGHLDVAEGTLALATGDAGSAAACFGRARARLDAATASEGPVVRYRERRLAVPSLARAIEEAAPADEAPTTSASRVLRIVAAERTVVLPDGERVVLEKHPALWRIVLHLVEAHASAPDEAVSVEALVAAGWPDERVRGGAGARRVYTALSTLRRHGMRAWILKSDAGYRLAPARIARA